ncbi:MAG: hypothetical protein AUH05_05555 [Ktedonobacter sp. 13_2_20CM_53_11]|nr:MAG: hypothetical protein AUH05_05555 [Ktedonobacter sp. 13_2_20CM_53_11]
MWLGGALWSIHFKEESISLCHPERSQGSLGKRSLAALRACPRAKRRDDHQPAVIFYVSSLMIGGLLILLLWWYATSNHRLVDKQLDASLIKNQQKNRKQAS